MCYKRVEIMEKGIEDAKATAGGFDGVAVGCGGSCDVVEEGVWDDELQNKVRRRLRQSTSQLRRCELER
jgi:hypothetical protein